MTYINPAFLDLWGFDDENKVLGRHFKEFWMVEEQLEILHMLQHERRWSGELKARKADGSLFDVQVLAATVFDKAGESVSLMSSSIDITQRKRMEKQIEGLNRLNEELLSPRSLDEKLKRITDEIVAIFDADFARIWITQPGDLCDSGCFHARVTHGPHVCRYRDRCLCLVSSSGRYTHVDDEVHRRVPFGCYKIGRVAAGEEPKFITNDVMHNSNVHDHAWARELGLVSFAGYRLLSEAGKPIGVLALFSKRIISPDEDALLEGLANTTAQVIQTARAESQRDAMLEALRESEARWRSVVENAPARITTLTRDGTILFMNRTSSGPTAKGVLETSVYNYLSPAEQDTVRQVLKSVFESGRTEKYETAIVGPDGAQMWFQNNVAPIRSDGQVVAAIYISTDITERVRAEDALRQLNRHLSLLNQVGQELATTLDQLQITEQLLQVVTETIGAEGASVWIWEEEQVSQPQSYGGALQDWLVCRAASPHEQGGSPLNLRVRPEQGVVGWVVRNGKSVIVPHAPDDARFFAGMDKQTGFHTLSLLAVPLRVRGKVIGVLEAVNKLQDGFVPGQGGFDEQDLSLLETLAASAAIAIDNAELVETLHRHTVDLQARNEDLDAYAHTVAHDLKGPLACMTGFAQALEENYAELPAKELCRHLRTVSQNGRKMNNIIDELLLMAGLRKAEVVLIPLLMASVVHEALEGLAYTIEECQAQIALPESWPAALGCDSWVEEVWVNYLSNALKYGGRPPRVELGAEEQADGMIRFWVRDNGPGLTPDEQERLFKSFERLDRMRAKGHGLGLSIVRRIVEKLGGKVGVESEIGQGSVFWFTLRGE